VTGANLAFQMLLATKSESVIFDDKVTEKFGMPNFYQLLPKARTHLSENIDPSFSLKFSKKF
jgi:hypothetical protein